MTNYLNKYLIYSTLMVILIGFILKLWWPINQDEGVFLAIANGIKHGHLPYRDFFDHKTPGIYYVLAGISYLSHKMIILRIINLIVIILSAEIVYLIGKIIGSKQTGRLAEILFLLLTLVFEGSYILTENFSILNICLVLLFFMNFNKDKQAKWLWLSGIMIGMATLFNQKAVIMLLILPIFLILIENKMIDRKKWIKYILLWVFGFILAWLPWILYFLIEGVLNIFWQMTIIDNFLYYPPLYLESKVKSVVLAILLTMPIWLTLLSQFIKTVNKTIRKKKFTIEDIFLIIILFNIPLVVYRGYAHYWLLIIPLVALVSARMIAKENNSNKIQNNIRLIIIPTLFLGILFYVIIIINNFKFYYIQSKQQNEIAKIVKQSTLKQDQIYTSRFNAGIYFLSDRIPASKYLYISEINNHEKSSKKAIEDLNKKKIKIVVWDMQKGIYEDYYAKDIRKYIHDNYQLIRKFPQLKAEIYTISH